MNNNNYRFFCVREEKSVWPVRNPLRNMGLKHQSSIHQPVGFVPLHEDTARDTSSGPLGSPAPLEGSVGSIASSLLPNKGSGSAGDAISIKRNKSLFPVDFMQ